MKKVRVGSSVGFACTLLVASPVLAQKTDGAVRLSMDGVVFAGEFGTLVPPSDPVLGSVEIDTTTTNAGLYAGSLGVGLAYAFSPNAVLGARLLHSSTKSNVEGDSSPAVSSTNFTLIPYGEYVAAVGPTVQPFIGAAVGFQSGSAEAGDVETTSTAVLFGLSAGLHLFPTDTFSIDPYVAYYRSSGSASSGSADLDYSGNTLLLGFSISGWIGGKGEGPEEPSDTAPVIEPVVEAEEREASVEPEPAPAPPPAARLKMVEDDDLLTGALGLTAGQLTLLGRPTVDAENIAVRVSVTAGDSKFESCRTGALLAGDHRFALRDMTGRAKAHGSQTIVVLQGNVGSRELSTFTEAEDARIVLCGRIFAVHSVQREGVGQYFEHFKELAIEAKTWNADASPASDPSGSGAAPTGTPAAPPADQPPGSKASSPAPNATPPATKAAPKPSNAPAAPPPAPGSAAPSGSAPPTGTFGAP